MGVIWSNPHPHPTTTATPYGPPIAFYPSAPVVMPIYNSSTNTLIPSSASVPTSSMSATETLTLTASSVSSAIVPPGSSVAVSSGNLATSATSFATATPVGPTSAPIVITTSGARLNSASVIATIGLIVAYFL